MAGSRPGWSIGFGLENIGRAALSWPITATLLVIAWTGLAAYGITQIQFNDEINAAFKSPRPDYQRYEAFRGEFGNPSPSLFVLFHGDKLATPDQLEALRDVALEVRLVDGIAGALSVFSLRQPPDLNDDLRPLLPATIPNGEALIELLRTVDDHPANRGRLLSADRSYVLIVVGLERGQSGRQNVRRIERDIQEIVADVGPADTEVTLAGVPVLRAEFVEQLIRDQYLLNGLGIVVSLLIGTLMLRSLRAAILTAVAPILAVVWVLGGMGLFGITINLMTNVLPVLILVVAFADSMHMTFGLRGAGVHRPARARAAAYRSLCHAGAACVVAGLTTAFAFASLTLSDSGIIESFGRAGALAILGAVVAVIVVHPLCVYWLGKLGITVWSSKQTGGKSLGHLDGIVGFFSAIVTAAPKAVLAGGLLLAVVAGSIHAKIWPVYSFMENIPANSPTNHGLQIVENELGGAHALYIPVKFPGAPGLSSGNLEHLGKAHKAVEQAASGYDVTSLWTAAHWIQPDDPLGAANRLDKLLKEQPKTGGVTRLSDDRTKALISVGIPDLGAAGTRQLIVQITSSLVNAGMIKPGEEPVTGIEAITATTSAHMITGLNYSLMLAVVLSIGVIMLAFRSIRIGLFALIPNLLPLFVAGAALVLFGKGLQFTSAIAMTIAFGIAVDDTVHYLGAFVGRRGSNTMDGVRRAYNRTGPAMVSTTVILCAGFMVTLFSNLPMVHLFGWLSAMTLAAALVADMIVLPAILLAFEKGRQHDGKRSVEIEQAE